MSFGKNLQFLRKMRNRMTQEDLAEKLGVSRQTVSKWELDMGYPEMDKVLELCQLFSCTMDQLIREDLCICGEAYSDIRTETVKAFRYVPYTVISPDPEGDAIAHVKGWAGEKGMDKPLVLGWDFPLLSQEQINVHHMHGYTAALVLQEEHTADKAWGEERRQEDQRYMVITIREPFQSPFALIPNAYRTLMTYMQANHIKGKDDGTVLPCFEREYSTDGVDYMDVYIAADM